MEKGEEFDDSGWEATNVAADAGSLGLHGRAIYRGHFTVTEKDLGEPVIEIWFNRIAGGAGVYVNGVKAGGSNDPKVKAVYDVKALLHPGDNVVSVAAANWGSEPSGISRGVSLVFQDLPAAVDWSRSAFNGLAEVIVQSSREAGTLKLTASADGLQPASHDLASRPATPIATAP
jgi:beta-galactosidase